MNRVAKKNRGFSLIELVIVVVMIAIIAAIAIPRMSRGAAGAADSALTADLTQLRKAIDLYQTEHQAWPTVAGFVDQMTKKTNASGTTDSSAGALIYGPYLRDVPTLPVGTEKGGATVAAAAASGVAWVYDASTGKITPNTGSLKDASDKLYTDY
jgi:general secretion pathway protein G